MTDTDARLASFLAAVNATIDIEGRYTDDPQDPGNWTGGHVGQGACHGTNWGISAASYPQLDIKSLTRPQALAIYQRDFWTPIHGNDLPPTLAGLVFDAAVNNGRDRAIQWLQAAAGAKVDGDLGPFTLAAIAARVGTPAATATLCVEYQAHRLDFMARLPDWQRFGLGWARRLCRALAIATPIRPA